MFTVKEKRNFHFFIVYTDCAIMFIR